VHLGGVVERERVQRPVIMTILQCLDAAHVLGHKRPVCKHSAFGSRGRPRSVEYLCHIHFVQVGFWLGGVIPASRQANNVEVISVAQDAVDRRLCLASHFLDVRLELRVVEERFRA
jgi:hypothetical protein